MALRATLCVARSRTALALRLSATASPRRPTSPSPSTSTSLSMSLSLSSPWLRWYAKGKSASPRVPKASAQRMTELVEQLNRYRDAYFNQSSSFVSDAEYDALVKELEELEGKYPHARLPTSPTKSVGAPVSSAPAPVVSVAEPVVLFKHTRRMLSLSNAYDQADVMAFLARTRKSLGEGVSAQVVAELKLDGLALALHYEGGVLVRAVTRGDGDEGQEVTKAVLRYVREGVPAKITELSALEVRGEVFIDKENFARACAESDRVYATPRNLASGVINRKLDLDMPKPKPSAPASASAPAPASDGDPSAEEAVAIPSPSLAPIPLPSSTWSLRFVPYSLELDDDALSSQHDTHKARMELLRLWGFASNDHVGTFELDASGEVWSYLSEFTARRKSLPYEIDGIVLKLNSMAQHRALGETAKVPRWAMAYKFPPDTFSTKVLSIDLQVGRSGKITPVANLEPIVIQGVTVSRATLHNRPFIRLHRVRAGARVLIERSGDVIPKVIGLAEAAPGTPPLPPPPAPPSEPATAEIAAAQGAGVDAEEDKGGKGKGAAKGKAKSKPASVPPPPVTADDVLDGGVDWTHCPCALKTPLVASATGVDLLCVHATCPSQSERRLAHFASSLDMKGLGPAIVKELMNYELLKDLDDVFELHKHRSFLTDLPGWAERSVEVLLAAIEDARNKATLADVLVALGIPHVGRDTAQLLTRAVPTFAALQLMTAEQLRDIPKMGDKTANAVYDYLHPQQPSRTPFLLTNLIGYLPALQGAQQHAQGAQGGQGGEGSATHTHPTFTGKSVVITGSFSKMERSAIEQRLKTLGAEIKPSVTAKVQVVVAGELKSTKKLDAAKSLGIRIVDEKELLQALEEATLL